MKMNLIEVYNLVDYETKMKIISDLLRREFSLFNKNHQCPSVKIENVNEFEKIECFLENNILKEDCLLISKDLLAYLKTIHLPDGIYLITKYYVPVLEIKIGSFGTIVDTIEITDYIKSLKKNQSFSSWIYSLLF